MTKPVALADDTYRRLKARKRPGESFSNVVDRLMEGQRKDPLLFLEQVPRSRIPVDKRLREIEDARDRSWTAA